MSSSLLILGICLTILFWVLCTSASPSALLYTPVEVLAIAQDTLESLSRLASRLPGRYIISTANDTLLEIYNILEAAEYSEDRAMHHGDEETMTDSTRPAAAKKPVERTPLPKRQLSLVYFIAAVEMITTHTLDPFFVRLILNTGITKGDERKAGYYSGIIGSVYCITEAASVFHWGWASDRHGRRPILLIGALGLSLTMLWFGMSSSYISLVISRGIQGSFNGAVGVEKSVVAELSNSSNIADAYAILAVVWTLGSTTGEYIGGLFAEPVTRWPYLFGQSVYFREHPYALPCIVSSLIALASAVFAYLWLKETLPIASSKGAERSPLIQDEEPTSSSPLLENFNDTDPLGDDTPPHNAPTPLPAPPPFRALLIPPVLRALSVYILQALSNSSHRALMPLVYATSIPNGGLGMSPYQIGSLMSLFGIFNILFQVLCTARLVRYWGPKKAQVLAHWCYLLGMALYPMLNYFARKTVTEGDGLNWMVKAVLVVQLACRFTNTMAFASIQIFVVHSAPSRTALGATNGLAQAVTSTARAIAPSIASSLFAVSQERNLLNGNFVYLVLCLISFAGVRTAMILPDQLDFEEKEERLD